MTTEDVLKNPEKLGSQIATKDFIKTQIDELISTIENIEKKSGKKLVGDRAFLEKPYEDCKGMTNLQVIHFFSVWRTGMLARYNGVKL